MFSCLNIVIYISIADIGEWRYTTVLHQNFSNGLIYFPVYYIIVIMFSVDIHNATRSGFRFSSAGPTTGLCLSCCQPSVSRVASTPGQYSEELASSGTHMAGSGAGK